MDILAGESFQICPVHPDSPEELAAVLAVYRQCEDFLALGPVACASAEMVQADLALSRAEGGQFCAIYDAASGAMLGVVDFVTSGFEGDPQLAYLSLLMIAAQHRSRGLGAAVVRQVEAAVRQRGLARTMRAGVQVNNPHAIRFWQQQGYQIVSGPEQQPDSTVTYRLLKQL